MCGRYLIDENDDVFSDLPGKKGEVCPGDNACIFVRENRIKRSEKIWGFVFNDTKKLIINARSETASVKPYFSELIKSNRILVPASAYFEYDSEKNKHMFGTSERHIYMAGLYRNDRFVILTTEAVSEIRHIHNRMPVILDHDNAVKWLDRNARPLEILESSLPAEVFS